MASSNGPVIRLQGGPRDRCQYHESDFVDSVRAAQLMGRIHHRPIDHPASWPLSYERPLSGLTWVWHPGHNCHPDPID